MGAWARFGGPVPHRGRHTKIFGWAKSAAYDRRYTSEILRLAILIQYRRVTDTHTQTDTRRRHIPR